MSEPAARGIVVGHGGLAAGLVDAARRITGVGDDVLTAISNLGMGPDAFLDELRRQSAVGPTVIFTDLPGGSCGLAAARLCREREDLVFIAGVNLPALLEFVQHRALPISELVPRLLDRGKAALCCGPEYRDFHADRSVPGR